MWWVILEWGMEGVLVRNIVKEVGLLLGVLCYYFFI